MSLVGVLLTSSSCQRSIEPDFHLRLGEIIKPIQLQNETLVGAAFPKTLEKLRKESSKMVQEAILSVRSWSIQRINDEIS
jgi:hypothetical protein